MPPRLFVVAVNGLKGVIVPPRLFGSEWLEEYDCAIGDDEVTHGHYTLMVLCSVNDRSPPPTLTCQLPRHCNAFSISNHQ